MTLERVGASHLLNERVELLTGRVLELGVGVDPYAEKVNVRFTLDISARHAPSVVGDAHLLPFANDSFDSILASQVFEHLHSPHLAAAELARVSSRKGHLIVAVPFLFPVHEGPNDFYRYTEWGLRRVLSPYFDVQEVVPYGGRLAAAIDVLATTTPSSSRVRRAVRSARKMAIGNDLARDRPWVSKLLLRRPGEFPCGFVAVCE